MFTNVRASSPATAAARATLGRPPQPRSGELVEVESKGRPRLRVISGRERARLLRRDDRTAPSMLARRPDPDAVLGVIFHEARLTCEQAAARSGLSPTRIAGIEDGDGLLIFADAVPLAAAYGRSVKELSDLFEHALVAGGQRRA